MCGRRRGPGLGPTGRRPAFGAGAVAETGRGMGAARYRDATGLPDRLLAAARRARRPDRLGSPRLLRTAAWMQAFLAAYQVHRPFIVHSGYRTRFTNEAVGGARASLHMLDSSGLFHAMDIHVTGISPEYLGRLAALAHQGGVGFYTDRKHGFVHIDDGRVRYWRG